MEWNEQLSIHLFVPLQLDMTKMLLCRLKWKALKMVGLNVRPHSCLTHLFSTWLSLSHCSWRFKLFHLVLMSQRISQFVAIRVLIFFFYQDVRCTTVAMNNPYTSYPTSEVDSIMQWPSQDCWASPCIGKQHNLDSTQEGQWWLHVVTAHITGGGSLPLNAI